MFELVTTSVCCCPASVRTGDSSQRDGEENQCKHIVFLCDDVLILVLCRLQLRVSGLCSACRVAVCCTWLPQYQHMCFVSCSAAPVTTGDIPQRDEEKKQCNHIFLLCDVLMLDV